MASRHISVTDEAYRRLKSRKAKGESFTGVIMRLTQERSLAELEGILTARQAEAMRRTVQQGRARSRRRRARQASEWRDVFRA